MLKVNINKTIIKKLNNETFFIQYLFIIVAFEKRQTIKIIFLKTNTIVL